MQAKEQHKCSAATIQKYGKSTPHVWVLDSVVEYDTPLDFEHSKGQVDWVRQGLPEAHAHTHATHTHSHTNTQTNL
jgi:hypothetical protein